MNVSRLLPRSDGGGSTLWNPWNDRATDRPAYFEGHCESISLNGVGLVALSMQKIIQKKREIQTKLTIGIKPIYFQDKKKTHNNKNTIAKK